MGCQSFQKLSIQSWEAKREDSAVSSSTIAFVFKLDQTWAQT